MNGQGLKRGNRLDYLFELASLLAAFGSLYGSFDFLEINLVQRLFIKVRL